MTLDEKVKNILMNNLKKYYIANKNSEKDSLDSFPSRKNFIRSYNYLASYLGSECLDIEYRKLYNDLLKLD